MYTGRGSKLGSCKSKAGKILEVKCKNETWTRVKTRKRERKKANNLGKEEERGDTKRERERPKEVPNADL